MSLGNREGEEDEEAEPEELPDWNAVSFLRETGRHDFFMCFVCLFAGEQEGFLFCGDCNGKAFFTGFPMTLVETKCGCIRIRTCFPKCIAVFIFFYEKGTD